MNSFSKIIAGTMSWGIWGQNFSTSEMSSLIEQALSLGISTFDHADIYGNYTTEASFGTAFKKSRIDRSAVQFISKCGIQYPCDNRPLAVKHYDYSKKHIISSVEQSLKHLKTDYLDLLLLHRPSPLMTGQEISSAFETLKTQGKVKQFGVSNFNSAQIDLITTDAYPVEWNQIECSLTQPKTILDGTTDYTIKNNIGVMAWSPLGSYFGEENDQNKRLTPLLKSIGEKYNLSSDQILISWLLKHPANIYPVLGTTKISRLEAAVNTLQVDLSIEDWFLLLEASRGHRVA